MGRAEDTKNGPPLLVVVVVVFFICRSEQRHLCPESLWSFRSQPNDSRGRHHHRVRRRCLLRLCFVLFTHEKTTLIIISRWLESSEDPFREQ